MEKENVFEKIQQFIHSQRRKLALFVCLMLIAGTLPESVFAAEEDSATTYEIRGQFFDENKPSDCNKLPRVGANENETVRLGQAEWDADKNPDYHYVWNGWYSSKDNDANFLGKEEFVLDLSNVESPNSGGVINVYAKFDKYPYHTVTFHSGTDDIPGAPTVEVPETMECYQTQKVDLSLIKNMEDVFVSNSDDTFSTRYSFTGWSCDDVNVTITNDNTFEMPDNDVTLTGEWKEEGKVYKIDFKWEKGEGYGEPPKSQSVVPDESGKCEYTLPVFDREYSSGYVTYKFEKWIVDEKEYVSGAKVTIDRNTTISGCWTKTYKSAEINCTLIYGDTVEADLKDDIEEALAPRVDGNRVNEAKPGTIVYLPKLDVKTQIEGFPGYLSDKWHVTVTDSNGDPAEIELSSNDTYNYFVMPEGPVTITTTILKETYFWKADGLVEITRDGTPFNQETPKGGHINIKVYVGVPGADTEETLKDESGDFIYNYSGVEKGTASIDIDVLPLDGYHIYKVEYEACYGKVNGNDDDARDPEKNGPRNTAWKKNDSNENYFLMDNVSNESTVKIYLTKTYTVNYQFEKGGETAEAGEYVEGFPKVNPKEPIYPFEIESIVTPCNRGGTEEHHSRCNADYGAFIKDLAEKRFIDTYPYAVNHTFAVPAVSLLDNKEADYSLVEEGQWKKADGSYVSEEDKNGEGANIVNFAQLTSGGRKAFIGSGNTIPLTVGVVSKTDSYSVTYEYKDTDQNVLAEVETPEGSSAEANTDVSVDATYTKGKIIEVKGKTYIFSGWEPEDKALKVEGNKFTMPARNVTIVGTWTELPPGENIKNVSYIYSDLTDELKLIVPDLPDEVKSHDYMVGSMVTVQTMAEKYREVTTEDGKVYVFSGWEPAIGTSAAVKEDAKDGSFTMPDEDVIFTGKWLLKSFNVTYVYADDTPEDIKNKAGLPNKGNPISHKIGDKVSVDATLKIGDKVTTDDGRTYTFNGWELEDKELKVTDNKFTMPAKAVTIVGTWTETIKYAPYRVEYYFEQLDGTYNQNQDLKIEGDEQPVGTEITAPSLKAQDTVGYHLNTEHSIVSGFLVSGKVLTLKLYYALDSHTVTFDGGDHGSISDAPDNKISVSEKYGSVYPKIPTPKPVDGYTFVGWYDKIKNEIITSFPDKITEDATYTALYKAEEGDKNNNDDDDDDNDDDDDDVGEEPVAASLPKSPQTGEGQADYELMLIAILSVMCSVAFYRRNNRN